MQTDSSASLTCLSSRSAMEWTATVRIPSSRQARRIRSAISPRLAMMTLVSVGTRRRGSRVGVDDEQRLAVLHGVAVLGEDCRHLSGDLRLDLIEESSSLR